MGGHSGQLSGFAKIQAVCRSWPLAFATAVARRFASKPTMPTADRLSRSFVMLHVVGPLFGLPICATLLLFDQRSDAVVLAFTAGVCLFWLIPPFVKRCGALDAPAFASVQLLTLVSLFGSYFYGGLNSPFAVWLIVAVLLSFLYVPRAFSWCVATAAGQLCIFLAVQHHYPVTPRLSHSELGVLFLVSTFAAALYISVIAAFYSRIKIEGSELSALAFDYEEAANESEDEIERLEEANRSLAQFIANTSHELRTSLNVVIGYSELLTEDAEVEERWARLRNLERIIGSSRQMIGLIAEISRQAEEVPAGAEPEHERSLPESAGDGPDSTDQRSVLADSRAPSRPGTARHFAAWCLIGLTAAVLILIDFRFAAQAREPGVIAASAALLLAAAFLGWQAAIVGRWGAAAFDDRDPLTGLSNRASFQREVERRLRSSDSGAALLFADLDGFKEVNDSLGHDFGDELLVMIAGRFAEILPRGALLARLGGDEFAVATFGARAEAEIRCLADAMLDAMAAPFVAHENHLSIGISIGIAHGEAHAVTVKELLRQSDIAMYRAKRDKSCPIRSFEASMDETLNFKRTMRQDLARALAGGELDLHLQPVVDARTGQLASAEALLRWTHPVLGPVSPAKLIALAEESGQIIGIDDWVLQRALQYAGRLGSVPIAINISPVQFRHPGFARKIVDSLEALSVPRHLLRLEITEGVLVTHTRAASRAVSELREAGLKIALDDFGTGFSSLGYLKDFGFDFLKVDRSFVLDLDSGRQASELLRAIVDLGHSLGMAVIAEGVETSTQAALVQLLGCDYIQGYFTGRALGFSDFEKRLTEAPFAMISPVLDRSVGRAG
jgi:diguanylate cyclase (GGDEF)-like protein